MHIHPGVCGRVRMSELQIYPDACGQARAPGVHWTMGQGNRGLEMAGEGMNEGQGKRPRCRVESVLDSISMLAAVTAASILLETMFLPVIQIFGSSMAPALCGGDFVVAVKHVAPQRGDIVAFYSNDRVLVKRVAALEGEQVYIDGEGKVYIDGSLLEEPYVGEASYGGCDISFPFQVPEGGLFVLGDNRGVSMDSRNSAVGCVGEGDLIGRVTFRIWPLDRAGLVR